MLRLRGKQLDSSISEVGLHALDRAPVVISAGSGRRRTAPATAPAPHAAPVRRRCRTPREGRRSSGRRLYQDRNRLGRHPAGRPHQVEGSGTRPWRPGSPRDPTRVRRRCSHSELRPGTPGLEQTIRPLRVRVAALLRWLPTMPPGRTRAPIVLAEHSSWAAGAERETGTVTDRGWSVPVGPADCECCVGVFG